MKRTKKKRPVKVGKKRVVRQVETKVAQTVHGIVSSVIAVFERWKKGEPLHALVKDAGVKRSKLRRNLIDLAGGKAEFKKLRDAGAGGTFVPFGKGNRPVRQPGVPVVDDKKVPVITSAKASDGWTTEDRWRGENVVIKEGKTILGKVPWRVRTARIYVSPEGKKYVVAQATERADLLYRSTDFPDVRLRLFETSSVARKEKEAHDLVRRGKEAERAKRRAKKEGPKTVIEAAKPPKKKKRRTRA